MDELAFDAPLPPATESMTLLVAGVIVHDRPNRRVVLLRRGPGAKFASGSWDLPVGKSEPGEPITQTAVRELEEETGIKVAPDDLTVVHVIHGARGVESPNGFLTVVFVAETWAGEPVNAEPGKHDEVRWIDADHLPRPFVATTYSALASYLASGPAVTLEGWS